MAAIHYPGAPGTVLYAGRPAVAPGSVLTTITLANESASAQAAGFVSPMFGMPFKQGDMPAGSYPRFELADGTLCPATLWGVTSWPDGSMKFCGAMIRVPAAVPGSGTLAITVKSGGIAPGASARSTADLAAADLKVELTGVANLAGLWTASLNAAIADAADVVLLGDGAAGKVWRIGGHVKQAGAAHGQLYCWHYVAALQDSSGGLLGLRYLGRAAQPFADVISPAPARRVVNASLRSGSTVIRALQGMRWVNPDNLDLGEELSADIEFPHYTSFFTAGTSGKWDFVQGGGSAASDATVHLVHDKTYFITSRLVPPYAPTLDPTQGPSKDYYPFGFGPMTSNMGTTGERNDIGVMTTWSVRHLLTQSAVDKRVVRVTGLASGGWRTAIRRQSNRQIIPCADPSPSYAGLGTTQKTWSYYPSSHVSGVQDPAVNTTRWRFEIEPSHRPAATYYAYLMSGEPQYLDLLVEQANGLMLSAIPGSREMNTTLPITSTTILASGNYGERDVVVNGTTYKGGGYGFIGGLVRVQAWGLRDIAEAAAICPDVCPQGTELKKYFRDIVSSSFNALNAYNAAISSTWANSGLYSFDPRFGAYNMWCHGYMSNSVCHQYSILGLSEIATFRDYLGKIYTNIAARMDLSGAISYGGMMYDAAGIRTESADNLLFSTNTHIVFDTGTSRFTVANIDGRPGDWSPTNGDVIAFGDPADGESDPDRPFAAAANWKPYYAVNASGKSAQLSETPGGAFIPVTSAVTVGSKFYTRLQNLSPHLAWENPLPPDGYFAGITGAILHHAATGDPGIAAAVAIATAKRAASGLSYVGDPKNALLGSYPS